ncbi:MAG: hypothetical protein H7A25_12795 [Leptospiraceae bacterium]|nr:hypothetical protein [Leptospiraceae bacterium]MCP5500777.1 hypothetical protein [Leptospiraceae bacterium]
MKLNKIKLILPVILGTLMSCASDVAYKKAVQGWSLVHTKRYVKYLQKDNRYENDADRATDYMAISGLQCLIDEDTKLSSKDQLSSACACARAKTKEETESKCKAWADSFSAEKTKE